MDFNKLTGRVMAILTKPDSEWPVIAGESTSTASLYKNYIIWLAAIPAVFGFIKGSLIGYSALGIHVREGIGAGLGRMILGWLLALVLIYVVALIINALAGTFEAQKSQIQALKTAAYAYTAYWVASIAMVVPWLGWLIVLLGGVYSIYLLYKGLPHTMQCPKEKAGGYTAVTVIITIVLAWILGAIVGGVFVGSKIGHAAMSGSSSSSSVTFDRNSKLGKLQAMAESMEEAGKKMDAARKSGDSDGAENALGSMVAAMSGSKEPVEALPTEQLKGFLPDAVNGMQRTSLSAERNNTMGLQVSQATAEYTGDGSKRLKLSIVDSAGAKALIGMAGVFGRETDKQTADGFERSFVKNGQMIEEKWNNNSQRGKYSMIIGERFKIEADGHADSFDDLKRAVASIDLKGLEKLKDAGVKK